MACCTGGTKQVCFPPPILKIDSRELIFCRMVLSTWVLDVLLLPVSTKVDSKVLMGYGEGGRGGEEGGAIRPSFLYY